MEIAIDPHPLLELRLFTTELPAVLGELASPDWLTTLLSLDAEAPLSREETVRATVRDLLRHGGYKPTGRGKPASEYLVRAAGEGALSSINLAVDACNVVSLHSGLPISVVDLARAQAPLRVGIAQPGTRYVFNRGGQEIDVSGLLCLFDAAGPCANAVKDAQRTKTDTGTLSTLSIVWGHRALAQRVDAAERWYRELLERTGARTSHLSPKDVG
jgi:DNA/RNA-binding domain of Phe-tRNA-synthetase-like protein